MSGEVGFITAWRRAIFFTLILDLIVFGTVSTVANAFAKGLVANVISVFVLMLCIIVMLLVYADKYDLFRGLGTVEIADGHLVYKDKKRHFDIPVSSIKKVDIEKINMGRYDGPPTAFKILIKTDRKKYYIESSRAMGQNYTELAINDLYIYIQSNI